MNTILKSLRTAALPILAIPAVAAAASALALSATGLLAFPQAASAQTGTPGARTPQVDEAVSALRAISTMRADFVQTDRNGQRIGGTMTLKRPGKIRFQYQKGVPFLIVSDGKALTMIDYEVRQVQRWPIRNSPLGALLDPNKDVARYSTLNPTAHPDVLSIAVKDPKHPEYGTITMVMTRNARAPGGWQLDSWVALDSQAKRTTVRLSNQQYGVVIPDTAFRWTDPRPQVRH